jgi:TolB protein
MTNRTTRALAAAPLLISMLGPTQAHADNDSFEPVSTIAFSNTFGTNRDQQFNNAEIYLTSVNPSGGFLPPRRLTDNQAMDVFATVSPDGKKIVFDSNRLRDVDAVPEEPLNTSDLFVMNTDGTEQTHLIRGASPTWSPDSKRIAFHASASGTGRPILTTPGSATSDSDLFIADVDDLINRVEAPRNVTNSPEFIDDDPDWSPDGGTLVFTRHDVAGPHMNAVTAEIYALDVDGTGAPRRLTFNGFEERAPDISPDGTRIVFMCRVGDPNPGSQVPTFELCVINADGDGTGQMQRLTTNQLGGATPNWSPDGQQIVFHRNVGGVNQLFVINPDDIDPNDPADPDRIGTQITSGARFNQFATWDLLRVKVDK